MDTMTKQTTKRNNEETAYQAALEAVRHLTGKQKSRLLAELQDASFRLDLADLAIDTGLFGIDLTLELPVLDFKPANLDKPEACPYCGGPNRA